MQPANARSSIAKAAQARDKPERPYEVRSERMPGLILRVQPTGKRVFYVQVSRGQRVRIGKAEVLSLKQAEEKARAVLLDPEAAATKTPSSVTLGEYVDGEFAAFTTARRKDAAGTLARIKAAWASLLDKRMSDISAADVDGIRTKRLTAGLSKVTVNRDAAALSSAFAHWVKNTPGAVHPLHGMESLDAPENARVRHLNAGEELRLRRALAARDAEGKLSRESFNAWLDERAKPTLPAITGYCDHLTPMVLLSLNTGMRRGEVFSLHWSAVNFQKRQLTVTAASAKTNKTRGIPLNDEALGVLQAIKPAVASGLVFASPRSGGRFDNVSKSWNAVLAAAKLDDFHWHDLRHTFASWMAMRGVSLFTIQKLLGHASSKMTERYAHLTDTHLAEAVAQVGAPKK